MGTRIGKRSFGYYRKYFFSYLRRAGMHFLPSKKPAFLIIGTQKAATTSLFNHLGKLPGLAGSTNKEIYYFDRMINYGNDTSWYHGHFRGIDWPSKKQYFEATPNYLYYESVPRKIFEYDPALKLLVVLRDPAARAYSAWKMYQSFFERKEYYRFRIGLAPGEKNYIHEHLYLDRKDFPSLEECLEIEQRIMRDTPEIPEPSLLRRGLYAAQLKRYLEYFPITQIKVIGYRDLEANPSAVVAEVYDWITGKSLGSVDRPVSQLNRSRRQEKMKTETKAFMDKFFAGEKERVEALVGKSIEW